MSEGVDEGLKLVDMMGHVMGGIELVSRGAVAALDCVELGALWRQHEAVEAFVGAGMSKSA
ncbi:hypothetical protein [Mesorhizobium sp.]|uniref:hypothetical protein n=1 Tax=Mesorhizobium sp. TaxID=1871066 RepID=UPI000FE546F9|nr:hypothetical protein [Mesorhizobium sp.]RWF32744.1 MAG: hypothetical protein EOS44_15600 [Mesorhizobium sp.]